MKELWIDPSYTGTGCVLFDYKTKTISFALFGNTDTKRSLINYYREATSLAKDFGSYLQDNKPDVIYMEYPPPFGHAASGLYGLQFKLLDQIFEHNPSVIPFVYGINPSYVSRHVKKYKESDSTGIRKKFALEVLETYRKEGWKVDSNTIGLLKKAGCDIQTALLFKYMSNLENKEWLKY